MSYIKCPVMARPLLYLVNKHQTLTQEVTIMRANANVLKGHEIGSLYAEWERVEEWAKRALTRERIAGAAVAGVTVLVFGVLFTSLYHALHNITIVAL